MRPPIAALLCLAVAGLACGLPATATPEATATIGSPTPSPTLPEPTPTSLAYVEEAILILEPGPGSTVVSPIHLAGFADTTFEQNLGIRLLGADGLELAGSSTIIASEMGTRGPFSADLPFSVASDTNGFVLLFSASPRDGGLTHLASVGVLLSVSGPAIILPAPEHPEDIQISLPIANAFISGGVVHIEGFGLASFEQTLVAEVYDADGILIGQEPITVAAPDLGFPGPFAADVAYTVSAEGPGRIVVKDVSPAHGQPSHLASVEVTLAP